MVSLDGMYDMSWTVLGGGGSIAGDVLGDSPSVAAEGGKLLLRNSADGMS